MAFNKKKLKSARKTTIFTKLLVTYILSIIIPLVVSGTLIVFAYQSTINEFLTGKDQESLGGIGGELAFTLQSIKIQTLMTLLIIVILSFFGSIFMSRRIVQPIRQIAKGTDEVAKGNLNFKLEVTSTDELGELARHFNEMTRQLREARLSLEDVRTSLEVKIKARTKELQELAEGLEEKVEERTKELQDRIDEMERFHRLTVGRELKMIELKKTLQEAQEAIQKLGQKNKGRK